MKKRLQSVAVTAPTTDGPIWIEVARAGTYKGYANGGFDLSVERLAEVVRNVRSHPSFAAGVDGVGSKPVVPWDFNHASEMPPTSGTVPSGGAPAQGWVLDVDVRPGPSGASLWALTQWGDLAREYIRAGQYRWASVTLIFDAKDPKTGASVGTLLTSIALTNTPFIEGMQPLAASMNAAQAPAGRVRVSWPSGVSKNTPAARALLASLAKGIKIARDDGAAAEAAAYHLGAEDDPADVERARQEAVRAAARSVPPKRIDASGFAGRNDLEKVIAAMRKNVTGFAQLGWEQQVHQACEAMKAGLVAA